MPLTDNNDPDSTGGTHWTAVVYFRGSNKFCFLDSLGTGFIPSNVRGLCKAMETAIGAPPGWKVEAGACARQANGYDCGVYVCAFAHLLAVQVAQLGAEADVSGSLTSMLSAVTGEQIRLKRGEIRALIDDLASRN